MPKREFAITPERQTTSAVLMDCVASCHHLGGPLPAKFTAFLYSYVSLLYSGSQIMASHLENAGVALVPIQGIMNPKSSQRALEGCCCLPNSRKRLSSNRTSSVLCVSGPLFYAASKAQIESGCQSCRPWVTLLLVLLDTS